MTQMIPAWVDGQLQPVEKRQTHLLGLRHKAVSVFLIRRGETLLQRRALGKYHTPGLWANTCCTHPAWEEDALTCAIRRLKEELGIDGVIPEHRNTVEYRADVGGGMIEHEVVELFVAEVGALTLAPNPDEVMDTAWMSVPDLTRALEKTPERFTPWLKIYMQKHAQDILRKVP